MAAAAAASSVWDFQVKDIDGRNVDLAKYKGKVVLVVNVASQCGFTPQYMGMQALYDKYKNKGFVLLGFPCNQFGGQEPGSNAQIKSFAKSKGATFPLMDKVDVNGVNEAPLYTYLKKKQGGLLVSNIKWNFTKFLIAKDGNVVKRYGSTTTPEEIEKDVASLLA